MHSSVMNALIKLLLNQGNKVASRGGERGERLPEKVVTDVLAQVLGFCRGQDLVTFCQVQGFLEKLSPA